MNEYESITIKCGLKENDDCGNQRGYGMCGYCNSARESIYGLLKGYLDKGEGGDKIIIGMPPLSSGDTLVGRLKRGRKTLCKVSVQGGKVKRSPKDI